MAAGPIAVAEALSIVRSVATALAEAHQHDSLQRDVKPANPAIGILIRIVCRGSTD